MSYEDGNENDNLNGNGNFNFNFNLNLNGNLNFNFNVNLYSFIFNHHDAIASWRHTPQSLRDSSPNLGEQLISH